MLTLSLSSPRPLSLNNKQLLPLRSSPPHETRLLHSTQQHSTSFLFKPLSVSGNLATTTMQKNKGRAQRAVCYSAPLTSRNLQLISTVSTAVLMLAKGTAIRKSFLVPLFALQAPPSIISWIQGEYGIWTAFLALIVRLFFFIPESEGGEEMKQAMKQNESNSLLVFQCELELPFVALLLVIVAPYQVMNVRGTQEGAILSLVLATYLAFQHFRGAGSLRRAFDQGSIVATLATMCVFAVPCLLLI